MLFSSKNEQTNKHKNMDESQKYCTEWKHIHKNINRMIPFVEIPE